MKKVISTAWRDLDVKPLGLYLYDSRGASGQYSYVAQAYEVQQVRETEGQAEFQRITRNGEAVYLHSHPELITAFSVASVVMPVLIAACDEADKRIPKRRVTKRKV